MTMRMSQIQYPMYILAEVRLFVLEGSKVMSVLEV